MSRQLIRQCNSGFLLLHFSVPKDNSAINQSWHKMFDVMVRHFRINLWQSWPGLITYSKNAETNTQLPRASSMKNGGHPNKFTMKGWNIAGRIRKQYIKIQQSHGFFWIKPWRDIGPFREFSSFRSRTGRDRDVIKWFRGNKSKWIALKFLCPKCFCI